MVNVTLETLQSRANRMRDKPTPCEDIFRKRLMLAGINFRFQFVIAPYIADFVIGNVVIELDGTSHNGREEYDMKRDVHLVTAGYRVIRILNSEAATYDLTYFKKRRDKAPKKKKLSKIKKENLGRRERQRKTQEREAEQFEIIQLPNGDFKKVQIKKEYKKLA